jgi:hypothetical protein
MQGGSVEEQSVAGRKRIGLVGVAIEHASSQPVDELDARMLEHGVGLG